jgi:hypothetical protein
MTRLPGFRVSVKSLTAAVDSSPVLSPRITRIARMGKPAGITGRGAAKGEPASSSEPASLGCLVSHPMILSSIGGWRQEVRD